MVLQIVNRVPQERQEIAVYGLVDKVTHAEIAEPMGVSPRTVGDQLAQLASRSPKASAMRRALGRPGGVEVMLANAGGVRRLHSSYNPPRGGRPENR